MIPAAGSGRRMGGASKPLLELEGEPILLRALRPFLEFAEVVAVRIALPEAIAADPPRWLREVDPRVQVVPGGAERTDSVREGLRALPPEVEIVAVHDGARPLVTSEIIRRCLEVAAGGRGALAGIPVVDTLKRVGDDGCISATVDRSELRRAQTPQAFPRSLLEEAYRRGAAEGPATDEAGLVERMGGAVVVVEGSPENLKVTTPEDMVVAAAILRSRG